MNSLRAACPQCSASICLDAPEAGSQLVRCPSCGAAIDRAEIPSPGADTVDACLPPETAAATPPLEPPRHTEQVGKPVGRAVARGLLSFLSPPREPGELGRLGPYRVLKVLGRGGMGLVVEAEDPRLKRLVAIKLLLPVNAAHDQARQRFLREAQAAAAIEHDHIVTIYQVGEEGDIPYMAMQLLRGEPLSERLKREGKLPAREVMRIGRQVAEGLAAAHEKGLIHRDIKSGNIWLESKTPARQSAIGRSRVKILDFGLARSGTPSGEYLTESGTVLGTPHYMAPEQARGKKVDGRADLFSLGVVLYQMSTDRLPFEGTDAFAVLTSLAIDTPKSPSAHCPDLPAALVDLIMKLLEKHPDDRPSSAEEVAHALRAIEESLAVRAPPSTHSSPMPASEPSPWAGMVAASTATPDSAQHSAVHAEGSHERSAVSPGPLTSVQDIRKKRRRLPGDWGVWIRAGAVLVAVGLMAYIWILLLTK